MERLSHMIDQCGQSMTKNGKQLNPAEVAHRRTVFKELCARREFGHIGLNRLGPLQE